MSDSAFRSWNPLRSAARYGTYIGVKVTTQGIRPSVQNAVTLVQDHIPGLHRHIASDTVVANNFQRPRFLHVLGHIDDVAGDERQSIDMSTQYAIVLIDPNSVHARKLQGLAGPFLQYILQILNFWNKSCIFFDPFYSLILKNI